MHSPYAKELFEKLLEKLGRKRCGKTEKLVTNLNDKFHYGRGTLPKFAVLRQDEPNRDQNPPGHVIPSWIQSYIQINSDKRRNG